MTLVGLSICLLASSQSGGGYLFVSEHMPRVAFKADLQLWRVATDENLVFGQTRRPVFVRASNSNGVGALGDLGVAAKSGRWIPATLDTSGLLTALAADGVELRQSYSHRPLLDVSVPEIRADELHQGQDQGTARRGRGVLVGIIDTGLDLTHPYFWKQSGEPRVLAVWDQDRSAGPAPPRFGYGLECNLEAIAAARCDVGDSLGHGTHVAGIAAGNGDSPGVAPEAFLAVVRSDDFTRLADAVAYLCDIADRFDLPLVINASIGGHYGPHDGRTPLETFLSELLGPGRLMVAAAGNDGDGRLHVGANLSAAALRVGLDKLPFGYAVEVSVDLWSSLTTQVELGLELWSGEQVLSEVALKVPDSEQIDGKLLYNGKQLLSFAYSAEHDADHDLVHRTLVLDMNGEEELPKDAVVALRFVGQGRVDGWLSQNSFSYGTARFAEESRPGWISGDGDSSLVVPATSPVVVSVGAYTVRTKWQSEDAAPHDLSGVTVGSLAGFSSRGPTLDNSFTGFKPDLTAPGSVIFSARALSIPPGPMTVDPERVVMQGTSMAAPHVTGVVALMLEVDPKLDPAKARELLQKTARVDKLTGALPDLGWGYGKLDAVAAEEMATVEASGCASAPISLPGAFGLFVWLVIWAWRIKPSQQRVDF